MLLFYNTKKLKQQILDYKLNNLIFIAGPSDRNTNTLWRHSFIEILTKIDNKFKIFLPEYFSDLYNKYNYDIEDIKLSYNEIIWTERQLLNMSSKIIFWVDRSFNVNRPGLTTNVEFGEFVNKRTNNCFCGLPKSADKINYLKYIWEQEKGKTWFFNKNKLVEELLK